MLAAGSAEADDHASEPMEDYSGDFTTVVTPLKPVFKIHLGDAAAWDLEVGPLWSVATASLSSTDVTGHCQALTCTPNKGKKDSGFGPPKPFHIGFVNGDRLFMPPHYAAAAFPHASVVHQSLTNGEAMRDEAVFTGSLWKTYPPQQVALDTWAGWRSANPRCSPSMISLPCGHGKSVICLAIATTQVRRVTLVLAHMRGLVDQWIEEARRYVPGARVGYIKADDLRIEGVDIIIASVQSLKSHIDKGAPYLDRLFQRVGFTILDEAHHGVASTFQYVMAHIPCKDRLAVTATPRRQDQLFDELQYIFGPVVFRSFRRPGDGQVLMLKYNSPVLKEHVVWGRLRKDLMENDLVGDAARTEVGVAMAVKLVLEQGRRVLIVTPRAAHVEELHARATELLQPHAATLRRTVSLFVQDPKPKKRRRRKDETEEEAAALAQQEMYAWLDSGPHGTVTTVDAPLCGLVQSDMDPATRKLNYEGRIVVATSDIMQEGISYNDWDTLLDMDDSQDPEQLVGRIQRAGDKRVPLVIDMWSPVSLYIAIKNKRLAFYKGEQFRLHYKEMSVKEDMPDDDFWKQFDRKAAAVL